MKYETIIFNKKKLIKPIIIQISAVPYRLPQRCAHPFAARLAGLRQLEDADDRDAVALGTAVRRDAQSRGVRCGGERGEDRHGNRTEKEDSERQQQQQQHDWQFGHPCREWIEKKLFPA